MNDVREVCYGNKSVNAKKLLEDISDALNNKPANPKKNADPMKNVVDAELKDEFDDLDKNLNINAILNGN